MSVPLNYVELSLITSNWVRESNCALKYVPHELLNVIHAFYKPPGFYQQDRVQSYEFISDYEIHATPQRTNTGVATRLNYIFDLSSYQNIFLFSLNGCKCIVDNASHVVLK